MAKDSEGEYARILRRIVDDPDYGRLPAPARLVWLTLLIAPEFKVLGIATLDVPTLARRTGLPDKHCESALRVLESGDVIRRDGVWCWIRNHLRFQENSEAWRKSHKAMQGLTRRLSNLPSGLAFMPEFVELYGGLGFKLELPPRLQFHIDMKSKGGASITDNPEPETPETPEPETPEPEAHIEVVEFYNRITGRSLRPATHEPFITPRIREGVTVTTLQLATIGACLSPHHVGLNDRQTEYLDPKTIFQAGRLDGHAERARRATYRIERGEEVWALWSQWLGIPVAAVMERFFRNRDRLLEAEGRRPIGPCAVYSSGYKPGDPWPSAA